MKAKRILSILLSVMMLVSVFPTGFFTAHAAQASAAAAAAPAKERSAALSRRAPTEAAAAPAADVQGYGDPCKVDLYIDPSLDAGTVSISPTGQHYVGQTVTLKATAKSGYTFMWWINYATEESSKNSTYSTVLTGDCEWDAVFKKNGEYFIYRSKPMDMDVTPGLSSYAPGTQVTLIAPPISGRSVVYEIGQDVDGLSESVVWTRIGSSGTFTMPNYDLWVRGLYSCSINLDCGPHGTATLSPSGPYYEGDTVTLDVTPDVGYRTKAIYGIPSGYTGSDNHYSFKVKDDDEMSLRVEFEELPTIGVNFGVYPTDSGTVSVTKNDATGELTAVATPQDGYHFLYWLDMESSKPLSTAESYTFKPTSAMLIYAVFYVEVIIYPQIEHGSLEVVNAKQVYAKGDTVTLLGHPDEGYEVDYYMAGELHGTSAGLERLAGDSFVMPANDMVASVRFARVYTVNVAAEPAAGGTVSGGGVYRQGRNVTVTAAPKEGYEFVNWTENGSVLSTSPGYSFTASADRNLTANFRANAPIYYTISAAASPAAGGSVTGGGSYLAGDPVTLTAAPADGYLFVNWTENGRAVSNASSYSFTADANRSLTANFEPIPAAKYTISCSTSPARGGAVSGGGVYEAGQTVTLSATVNAGYVFDGWVENGTTVSTDPVYSFSASMDRSLTASFHRDSVNYPLLGDGSEEDPYRIGSREELLAFASLVNGGTQRGARAVLTDDVNLGNEPWAPIGETYSAGYAGVFDGQGHSITGLNVNLTVSAGAMYAGLFGYVNGGTVKNLHVQGSVTATGNTEAMAGGIVGSLYRGTIEYCEFNGSVKAIRQGGDRMFAFAGGIAGSNSYATLRSCTHSGGDVLASCSNHSANAGGVAGSNTGTLQNCSHTGGTVTASANGYGDAFAAAGGVTGTNYNGGNTSFCFSAGGKVSAGGGVEQHTGGVVGEQLSSAGNCYYLTGTAAGGMDGADADGAAMPLSAGQLKEKGSFRDWDFEKVWYMGENWPVLRGEMRSFAYLDPTDAEQPEKTSELCAVYLGQTTLNDGWYAVTDEWKIAERIQIQGEVHLILCNGAALHANAGITVAEGNSLTIWAQSDDEELVGALNAAGASKFDAAIGGAPNQSAGSITINGGAVTAVGGSQGAGIGGGGARTYSDVAGSGGTITIGGGFVRASSVYGAGIGGGSASGVLTNGGAGGTITIGGGRVIASTDSTLAQAIGYGYDTEDPEPGSLSFGAVRVFSSERAEEPVTAEEREEGCRGMYTAVESCLTHAWGEWTVLTPPSCTELGSREHVCAWCTTVGSGDIPALGHDWDVPTYGWSADDTSVTAIRICKTDFSHFEKETAAVTVELVKEASCDEEGEIRYTAVFANEGFQTQVKTITIPKLEQPLPELPCSGGDDCPGKVFTDIPKKGHWAHDAIDWAVVCKITAGTSATTFSPNNGCTRGQVVTFLWRAAGEPEPKTTENPFTDVKTKSFCYKAVLWAAETGITKGVSATSFNPDATCTRGQIVTFLWRFASQPEPASSVNPFKDLKPGAFYEKAVLWAAGAGVTEGTSVTTFSPDNTCTRAQIVTFLYRDLVKKTNSG